MGERLDAPLAQLRNALRHDVGRAVLRKARRIGAECVVFCVGGALRCARIRMRKVHVRSALAHVLHAQRMAAQRRELLDGRQAPVTQEVHKHEPLERGLLQRVHAVGGHRHARRIRVQCSASLSARTLRRRT